MKPDADYEVVVVGFGPVGAIAACWLGQAGVKTLVVEKTRAIWDIPRAIALDHEILRVFQNIGVVEEILPYTAPFGASEHFGADGQLIRRIDVISPPYPLGYLPNMVFTQPPVEAILRSRAEGYADVTVRLGSKVTGIYPQENNVRITIEEENGQIDSVSATFVIGCDGASSATRQMLGFSLDDLGFDEPWLVVDVVVNDDALAKLPKNCAQFCDPARPYTYIIGPGNHRRWEIMLLPSEDPKQMESEVSVWSLLSRWLEPSDGRLWRASSYRFHALVAHKWRNGRVFLAGDAAHQQPPFIGQGMCQGVRDITNLCWKLVSVLRDQASDSILDTYESERSEHVRTLTGRVKEIGAAICIRNPEKAQLRDAALIQEGRGSPLIVTRQEIVPPLQSGLIATQYGPAAGTLFPQPNVATEFGTFHLDELTGSGWRIFIDGRLAAISMNTEKLGMPCFILGGGGMIEAEGVVAAWFDRYSCVAAIVRPDHYVYCSLSKVADIEGVCSEIRHRLRATTPGIPIS